MNISIFVIFPFLIGGFLFIVTGSRYSIYNRVREEIAVNSKKASLFLMVFLCFSVAFPALAFEKEKLVSLEHLISLANAGNSEAQHDLGILYNKGIGLERDYKKAIEWLEKAASQGDVRALYDLGTIYTKGFGVAPNSNIAVRYYVAILDRGEPLESCRFGDLYYEIDTSWGGKKPVQEKPENKQTGIKKETVQNTTSLQKQKINLGSPQPPNILPLAKKRLYLESESNQKNFNQWVLGEEFKVASNAKKRIEVIKRIEISETD